MGAAAVLRAVAQEHVQADGIILECPFDTLHHAVRNRFQVMGVPSFPASESLTFWGGVQQGFWAFGHRPVDDARSVTCPALILHGEQDRRATVDQVRAVHAALASGHKTLRIIPGIAHQSCLAADPAAWRSEVTGLVGRMQ